MCSINDLETKTNHSIIDLLFTESIYDVADEMTDNLTTFGTSYNPLLYSYLNNKVDELSMVYQKQFTTSNEHQ